MTLFFVVTLMTFSSSRARRVAGVAVGIAFYLWIGIFNLMVIAQFWSFANDLYTPEQGKRLFAIVGFGASLGAVVGAVMTVASVHAARPDADDAHRGGDAGVVPDR